MDFVNEGSKIYIGIDPGITGAIAGLAPDGRFLLVDTPTVEGERRRDYDLPAMAAALKKFRPEQCRVILESLHPMAGRSKDGEEGGGGGTGVFAAFGLGRSMGAWEMALVCLGFDYRKVSSQKWKRGVYPELYTGPRSTATDKSKDVFRVLAVKKFPMVAYMLQRKKDGGRADALLMAEFGRMNWLAL